MLTVHPWMMVATGVASGIIVSWIPDGWMALALVIVVTMLWSSWLMGERIVWTMAVLLGWWCGNQE